MKRPSGSLLTIVILLGSLAVLYRTVGDRTLWGECLTVWPPLLWCAVLAPRLVVVVVRRQGKEVAIALGVIAAFLAVTMEWPRLGVRKTAAPAGALTLRVVSWNTAGGIPLDQLAALQPDICLLQEIGHVSPADLRGFWQGWVWRQAFDPGMLSRFPATRLPARKIGPWAEPLLVRLDLPGGRRVVVMNVRLVLPAFVVAVASFEWSPVAQMAEAHRLRLRQYVEVTALLRETLAREGVRSAILCGDFNTPGGARSIEPLRPLLQDVWPRAGEGWGATMTAEMPVSRIDQCWVTPDIEPLAARVVRGRSDHRALVVDVAIR